MYVYDGSVCIYTCLHIYLNSFNISRYTKEYCAYDVKILCTNRLIINPIAFLDHWPHILLFFLAAIHFPNAGTFLLSQV